MLRVLTRDHPDHALENLVLRQRLKVLKRPRLEDSDRAFWVLMCEVLEDWEEYIAIGKPETVRRGRLVVFAPAARTPR